MVSNLLFILCNLKVEIGEFDLFKTRTIMSEKFLWYFYRCTLEDEITCSILYLNLISDYCRKFKMILMDLFN